MNLQSPIRKNVYSRRGFTLIEILAVMVIMGLLAEMIISLAPGVQATSRRRLVESEKNKLVHMIENYHDKFGYYPPDNP
jgi:prepilin-type N-terminal cleavage/methylation domain-containing protein